MEKGRRFWHMECSTVGCAVCAVCTFCIFCTNCLALRCISAYTQMYMHARADVSPSCHQTANPFYSFPQVCILPVFSNLRLVGQMKHQYHPITLDLKTRTDFSHSNEKSLSELFWFCLNPICADIFLTPNRLKSGPKAKGVSL